MHKKKMLKPEMGITLESAALNKTEDIFQVGPNPKYNETRVDEVENSGKQQENWGVYIRRILKSRYPWTSASNSCKGKVTSSPLRASISSSDTQYPATAAKDNVKS